MTTSLLESLPAIECLDRDSRWHPFGDYTGFEYQILDVDRERCTVDMLFHFEPDGMCFYHRHHSVVMTHTLAGEHHIHEVDDDGGKHHKVRPAGTFAYSSDGHAHIEGGGPEGAVVLFSFRGTSDHIYDILNDDLSLRREVTIDDFFRAYEEQQAQSG